MLPVYLQPSKLRKLAKVKYLLGNMKNYNKMNILFKKENLIML